MVDKAIRFAAKRRATALAAGGLALLLAGSAHAVCVGDCNGDGVVTVDEIVLGVNIALGNRPVEDCEAFADAQGQVTVSQLVQGVNNALNGCPDEDPTATPTLGEPTSTPTEAEPTSTPTPEEPTPTPFIIDAHTCTLGEGSEVAVIAALPLPAQPAIGAIDIDCGAVDVATGKASCLCAVQAPGFDGLSIAGLFWACVKPASEACAAGEIDCDGGNILGLDVEGNRNVGGCSPTPCVPPAAGSCTSNAECSDTCATHCGGVENVFQAGCEGFCTLGEESPCTTDAFCASIGEGSCNGPDGLGFGNICNCTCLDGAVGEPSGPGGLQCQLGFNLTVEPIPGNGLVCDGADVSINVGDTCAPLTTESAVGIINNANNTGGMLGPFSGTGMTVDCLDLQTSSTSGLQLRGAQAFYASTIGDILAGLTVNCE